MKKADASISIGADGSAFSKTMQDMVKNTDTMANSITARLARMGQAFEGLKSIGRDAASVITALTEPAAHLENVATSLGVVMGNREAAERLTGSLERMATNGVVSFDELHRSARALTNVFQDDAVISHYVSRLADIAAGAEIPASRLAELVARMEDVGKAELTELANKGVPIYEALSEVMGKSRAEAVKMGNEGKVSCSAFLASIVKLTDAGGRYHKMNSELSNTTKGSWDTLTASITECMAVLGKPINDAVRPVLQDMAFWVQSNKSEIQKLGATVAPVFQAIAAAAGALGKVVVALGGNVHTLTVALGIMAVRMYGPAVLAMGKIRVSMNALALNLSAMRMQMGVSATMWGTMWAGMVMTARAASVAIKAALVRTGVGVAVWLIGEGVAWLIEKYGDAGDAAKNLEAEAADAEAAVARENRELQRREEANRDEQERTRQLEEQARLTEQAADAERDRLKAVRDQVRAREDAEFEREMDALRDIPVGLNGGTRGVIRARLRRVGAPSEEALYAERARLERSGHMSEEMKARYDAVADAIAKIEAEHRKAEEAVSEHAQRVRELQDNYYDRKSRAETRAEDEAYHGRSIAAQAAELRRRAQRAGYWGAMDPALIREYTDEMNRRDAEGNVRSIAQLERVMELYAELQKRKQEYQQLRTADMAELRIQALELQGRKRAADALREELALQERITELRERGATKRQATQQAEMEAKVRQAAEQRARIQAARVEFIQGHQASVGGGGVSFRLGSTQLQESRKHSRLLKEIRDYLRGQRNATSGVAVLA